MMMMMMMMMAVLQLSVVWHLQSDAQSVVGRLARRQVAICVSLCTFCLLASRNRSGRVFVRYFSAWLIDSPCISAVPFRTFALKCSETTALASLSFSTQSLINFFVQVGSVGNGLLQGLLQVLLGHLGVDSPCSAASSCFRRGLRPWFCQTH